MNKLITTRVQQSRAQASVGNLPKAIELLEQARVLARGDRAILIIVLRELVDLCHNAGRYEQATLVAKELASLSPGENQGVGSYDDILVSRGAPRKLLGVVAALAIALIATVGVIVWMMSGQYYGEQLSDAQEDSAETSAYTDDSDSPDTPPDAPTASSRPSHSTAKPVPLTVGGAEYAARAALIKANVGMLVKVAKYQGTVNNQAVRFEMPIGSGSCFAIARHGIVLSNKHVTATKEDDVPNDLSAIKLPTLTRREIVTVVCFGATTKDQYEAEILHESSRYDLAVLKIKREFSRPFLLNRNTSSVIMGQSAYTAGYPGIIAELLQKMNQQEMRDRIIDNAAKGSIPFTSWFAADAYEPTLTVGVVSSPVRRLNNASYIQLDAKITHGNSGGPLLNQSNQVVGITTLGLGDAGHEAYNFALSTPQLIAEIEPYMRQP